jgi:hypothetical protein
MINHCLLHKTIADYGGLIVGGYMRAWVLNGEPSDHGWSDVDVFGIKKEFKNLLKDKIKEATNGRKTDFKYLGIVCNFHCNSWIYDGRSIYREKTKYGKYDDLEVLEQTKSKMAVLVSDVEIGATKSSILKHIQKYNFTVHNSDGTLFDLFPFMDVWLPYLDCKINKAFFNSESEKIMIEKTLNKINRLSV